MTGRLVQLELYTDHGFVDQTEFAMQALKKSMLWDEKVYGLSYDLDIYMIVAVKSFNMGAMENKGLNIFNSSCVFADIHRTSDEDFLRVLSVIGHEYFHNWTGNRITCRDWFQLTLKEGLTVFRDQEFSADHFDRSVRRLEDIQHLRIHQFEEDAGPNAHPIRPPHFVEINNFYTMTIYEKGAEVIRMLETLLGRQGFRKGMDLYVERFDGMAVTTEDFLQSMRDANNNPLEGFERWYQQIGTPIINVESSFEKDLLDENIITARLQFSQKLPMHSSNHKLGPLLIPVKLGLIAKKNQQMLPLTLKSDPKAAQQTDEGDWLLLFNRSNQEWSFDIDTTQLNLSEESLRANFVWSLNRGFSAPVKIQFTQFSEEEKLLGQERKVAELETLIAVESDPFQRFESCQQFCQLLMGEMFSELKKIPLNKDSLVSYNEAASIVLSSKLGQRFLQSFLRILKNESISSAFKGHLLKFRPIELLLQEQRPLEIELTYWSRLALIRQIGISLYDDLKNLFENLLAEDQQIDQFRLVHQEEPEMSGPTEKEMSHRVLKNVVLQYLTAADPLKAESYLSHQFFNRSSMTEVLEALRLAVFYRLPTYKSWVKSFEDKWSKDYLLMNKLFAIHMCPPDDQTWEDMHQLAKHWHFNLKVPNTVRALYQEFQRNLVQFHHPSGRGYDFMAKMIGEIDAINPGLSTRLIQGLNDLPHLPEEAKEKAKKALGTLARETDLSANLKEVLAKILRSVGLDLPL